MNFNITTGFGYFKNAQGYITDKCIIPIGTSMPITNGYEYFECVSQEELDQIIFTRPFTEDKETKIEAVKLECKTRIIALIPNATYENHIYKELETLNRMCTLLRREASGIATAEESTELDNLQALNDAIEAIKTASNLIGAEIEALSTIEAVEHYDIETNHLWP